MPLSTLDKPGRLSCGMTAVILAMRFPKLSQIKDAPLKITAIAAAFLGCLTIATAHAADNPEAPPEAAAASFVATFFHVKPEAVNVSIIKREGFYASAITMIDGEPTCTLDMAQAPSNLNVKLGWLVGGFVCDQSAQPSGKS